MALSKFKTYVDDERFPFNTNHHLSRRFVYLQGTSGETMWDLSLRRIKIADQHKRSPETLLAGQFDENQTT